MNHFIFMRSCRKDIPWLELSLQTILRYASGFTGIQLTFPFEDLYPMDSLIRQKFSSAGIRMQPVPRMTEDYLGQQMTKLMADAYLGDQGYVTFLDSDTMLTGPFDSSQLFAPEFDATGTALPLGTWNQPPRPLFLHTPYEALATDQNVMAWQGITQHHMGEVVEHEFMRRLPITVRLADLAALRKWYHDRTGIPLQHVVQQLSQNGRRDFSEFNLMGAYCWKFARPFYAWIDTTKDAFAPLPIKQYWSWGGLQAEHVREINGFLTVPQLPSATPSDPLPTDGEDRRPEPESDELPPTFEDAQRVATEDEVGL